MRVVLFANTDWYLYNFRLSLAREIENCGHDLLLISPPGDYGDKLLELGFNWQAVPMVRRSLNPFRELALLMVLVRLFRNENVQLVHSFTIKCVVYGSLAGLLAGVRARVGAVTGLGYVFLNQSRLARLLRPLVRVVIKLALSGKSSRLIVQNPDDGSLFREFKLVDADHIRLIAGSGVDCEKFHPSRSRIVSERPVRVLFAARLLWDKGFREFVEAIQCLSTRACDAKFLVAGESDFGNPAAVPTAQVIAWTEQGLYEWLGHVDDMAELLATVDLVVLPSYREGLPRGLIEAAAMGLPLISTDVPGCREVVAHGVSGILVPARECLPLADAIQQLVADREMRIEMGRRGREKMLQQFDEKIVLTETLAVYRELLADK